MRLSVLCLCLVFLATGSLRGQFDYGSTGKIFWLGYMENLTLAFNGAPEFQVLISADEPGTATIGTPATGFSFSQEYGVGVTEVVFPEAIYYGEGSDITTNFGMRIETTSEVDVTAVHYRIYFTDATLVLPQTALAANYRVMATSDLDGLHASEFVVLATEDNTEVTITPTANTLSLYPVGVPFDVTLDAGESYQVQSLGDLTGSRVEALGGQKLAVFGGAVQADISCSLADNHLWDQTLPIHPGDTLFMPVPFSDKDYSVCKILAHTDGTTVQVGTQLDVTLDAGEWAETELSAPTAVQSSAPISVSLLNPSQSCTGDIGDPSLLNLLPPRCYIDGAEYEALVGMEGNTMMFSKHHVTILAEGFALPNVTLDGTNLSSAFTPYPDLSGWFYTQIEVDPGEVDLGCPAGCTAWATGFGDYDGYTFHLPFIDKEQYLSVNGQDPLRISLFPNPAKNQFSIQTAGGQWCAELYTVSGQHLGSRTFAGTTVWDTTALPSGIYLVQVTGRDGQRSLRVAVR